MLDIGYELICENGFTIDIVKKNIQLKNQFLLWKHC
jgi:hypothetical protein